MSRNARHLAARLLIVIGGVATVIGAIDPMEGSILILPGSALLALGVFLGGSERRVVAYRVLVLVLLVLGIGALWGLSFMGGFGGTSGRSMWWGLLLLPYLLGLPLAFSGPGSPRWLPWFGIGVGAWYLTIFAQIVSRSGLRFDAGATIGAVGLLMIGGCCARLIARWKTRA